MDLLNIIGKKVKVIKDDPMDIRCNIDEKLRWHIGDEITVCKVEILPYGCFLYDDKNQNVNIKRIVLKNE